MRATDDIMDVAQEEATEDFQKSAAVLGHAPQLSSRNMGHSKN
jgi:Mg/Co/Ni transporter MgtE